MQGKVQQLEVQEEFQMMFKNMLKVLCSAISYINIKLKTSSKRILGRNFNGPIILSISKTGEF